MLATKIIIEKPAQQTSSYLDDSVLVVGEDTHNNSQPILEIEADDVKASQQQLDFHDEFLNYKADGKVLEDLGKEDIDGTECFKLKLTNKNGEQNTYYIDPTDYMVIKMTNKSTTDGQETESSTAFSNYKKLDEGIVVAMNISAQFGDFETTKIEINPVIDEVLFKVQP